MLTTDNSSPQTLPIGIIVAMDKELLQLQALMTGEHSEQHHGLTFHHGLLGQKPVVVVKCGIGKVNAALGASTLIDIFQPAVVISTGCAGGASPSLEVGQVVVSRACTYHDVWCGSECQPGQILGLPDKFPSPEALLTLASHLGDIATIHEGLIVTGDWFVDSREKMRAILETFPQALAVDMESAAIAQTCWLRKVPFVSFRVISDVPLNDHKASQYYDFWNRLADRSFHITRAFIEQIDTTKKFTK